MEEYLRGVIDEFPEEITETTETPAASNLFNVRDKNERSLLDKTRAQAFHHAVAQLLFTGIRCRKDAQTSMAFLTTRVRKPYEGDWKKLRILLGYLKRTIKLTLTLRTDRLNVLKWWVGASYASHDNIREHTGGIMSMGSNWHGSIIIISEKQRLNTKIGGTYQRFLPSKTRTH